MNGARSAGQLERRRGEDRRSRVRRSGDRRPAPPMCRPRSGSRRSTTTARCGARSRCTSRPTSSCVSGGRWPRPTRRCASEQPYKAVVENDRALARDAARPRPELVRGVSEAFGGITTDAVRAGRSASSSTRRRHPTLGVDYTSLSYRPMRELISFLEANEFRVFICTGGGRDFVRVVGEEMNGHPARADHRLLGDRRDRDGALMRNAGVEQPIDDGPGKPAHIWSRTGRLPLFAGRQRGRRRRRCSRRHGSRSWSTTTTGSASSPTTSAPSRRSQQAQEHDWTVASMKDDFETVFD